MTILGTCSICGGVVVLPEYSTRPVATCRDCGATKQNPHGPVIPMTPKDRPEPFVWPNDPKGTSYTDGLGHQWSKD